MVSMFLFSFEIEDYRPLRRFFANSFRSFMKPLL